MRTARTIVITGGTAGVGRATAQRFAREGDRVAVLARGADGLAATQRELEQIGSPGVLALPCDVADPDELAAAAVSIEDDLGPIDVWINNAMVTVFAKVDDLTPAELRRVTDVTYLGAVWGTRVALAHMRRRCRGTIIQVGSALAYRAIPLQAAYCAAKAAVRAFTDSLRTELDHEGSPIHLCMVQLPAVNTPQFRWCLNKMPYEAQPVPPIYQPEIIADSIWYASNHRRREVYVGAPTVEAVLGNKLAPGALDHYLSGRGWQGQLTATPADPTRPNNLFEPVDGDPGAHGVFDSRARTSSAVAAITTRLGAAGVRVAALAAVAAVVAAAGLVLGLVIAP
jgi:NAD(P)-dependent dehydrogenase (short-subunit alcohol dehydrogenase family)